MPNSDNKLPLISFVVINHNYGSYLRQCVESIFAQDYHPFECIVVDNASTDHSRIVLAELKQEFPHLELLLNDENLGQCAAFREAFRLTTGDYIVIVDADDYLLPAFAGTHLRVHLTVPGAVGFTSADMIQLCENRVVLGTYFESSFSRLSASAVRPSPDYQIEIASLAPALETHALEDDLFSSRIRIVKRNIIHWVWSPTSGNMYRRDALNLFVHNENLEGLRFQIDAYFNYGINVLTGSILIEKPLAAYRIHSNNNFTRTAALRNLLSFPKDKEDSRLAAVFALEHVNVNFSRFHALVPNLFVLLKAMYTLRRKATGYSHFWFDFEQPAIKLAKAYFGAFTKRARKNKMIFDHKRGRNQRPKF